MEARVKILLVDDNPTIRKLLARSLEKARDLVIASDGADALMKAIEEKPDLIISDYSMPVMDGRALLGKLRERGETKAIPFVFLASQKEIDEQLRMLVEGVEDYFVKPFFVFELSQAARRIVDRLRQEKISQMGAHDGVISGRLSEMNIMDLMQTLEMGRKSCALALTAKQGKCVMYFTEGSVTHATLDELVGNEAVYKAVGWTDGRWEIDFTEKSEERSTTQSTQGLMIEGLRLLDEANRDAG